MSLRDNRAHALYEAVSTTGNRESAQINNTKKLRAKKMLARPGIFRH